MTPLIQLELSAARRARPVRHRATRPLLLEGEEEAPEVVLHVGLRGAPKATAEGVHGPLSNAPQMVDLVYTPHPRTAFAIDAGADNEAFEVNLSVPRFDGRPARVVRDGAEEVGCEASPYEKVSARGADFVEEFGTVAAGVDAYEHVCFRTDRRANAVDVLAKRHRIVASEAAIARAKDCAHAGLRFGDDAEKRMIARATVVAGKGARLPGGRRAARPSCPRRGEHGRRGGLEPQRVPDCGHHPTGHRASQMIYTHKRAVRTLWAKTDLNCQPTD